MQLGSSCSFSRPRRLVPPSQLLQTLQSALVSSSAGVAPSSSSARPLLRLRSSMHVPGEWNGLESWRSAPIDERRVWGPKSCPVVSGEDGERVSSAASGPELASADLANCGALVLATEDPLQKAWLTHKAFRLWKEGKLEVGVAAAPDSPGRPSKPELVPPRQVPSAKDCDLSPSAHMLHNLAHIELNAIDLAWDTIVRFSHASDELGRQFYADFLHVADDESRHFRWCSQRLKELGFRAVCLIYRKISRIQEGSVSKVGALSALCDSLVLVSWSVEDTFRHAISKAAIEANPSIFHCSTILFERVWRGLKAAGVTPAVFPSFHVSYGDMPAHNLLWKDCLRTSADVRSRLAVIPMMQEARGLDAGPRLVKRLLGLNDHRSAAIVRRIGQEEVAHVGVGVFHFLQICERLGVDPGDEFKDLMVECNIEMHGPFNHKARELAGLQRDWYDRSDLKERQAVEGNKIEQASVSSKPLGRTGTLQEDKDQLIEQNSLAKSKHWEESSKGDKIATTASQSSLMEGKGTQGNDSKESSSAMLSKVYERLALVVSLEKESAET